MANLCELLLRQRDRRPELMLGVIDEKVTLAEAVDIGMRAGQALVDFGLEPGDRVAVVDGTSTDYLLFWVACQFAGLSPALINPGYPEDLLDQMLASLAPHAIAFGQSRELWLSAGRIVFGGLKDGRLELAGCSVTLPDSPRSELPGVDSDELSCAGFMHTSGTTGPPKFCVQSHRYFRRASRFLVDMLGLTEQDRVFAPLPMFHVNPMVYGFLGALTAGADLTALSNFVPQSFWRQVKATDSTALILHAPPVRVLLQRCLPADAAGHRVRTMFYADADFMETFKIPTAAAGYGSTEAGGLTHLHVWQGAERILDGREHLVLGHRAGLPRPDIDWKLGDDGEISVRGKEPGILSDGYWVDGDLRPLVDADGWFPTGDLGRRVGDELEFVQRLSESIRVRGEYVPIQYVEHKIAVACGNLDIALWKADGSDASDERAVLYVAGDSLPVGAIRAAVAGLPRFMRPVQAVRIEAMPVDGGAGKVRKSQLSSAAVIEACEL